MVNRGLEFKLVKKSGVVADPKIEKFGSYGYSLSYPCKTNSTCTAYESVFPPGSYLIKAFGASGGGSYVSYRSTKDRWKCFDDENFFHDSNVDCFTNYNTAGAGALVSGILTLTTEMKLFFHLGGSGEVTDYFKFTPGGYNGGGGGLFSSGGGSTDVRASEDSYFSRILVAGGGGGTDDTNENDGIGGSAGGLKAQSFWILGSYQSQYEADQEFGFSFFQGESCLSGQTKSCSSNGVQSAYAGGEQPGAGGGWNGGFSSHHSNGGAGAGSSFALTLSTSISNEEFVILDQNCRTVERAKYSFLKSRPAYFEDVAMKSGAWKGSGRIEIFVLNMKDLNCRSIIFDYPRFIMLVFFLT